MQTSQLEKNLKDCPSTSFWLKQQLNVIGERDIVDALNDVETLLGVLNLRFKSMTEEN